MVRKRSRVQFPIWAPPESRPGHPASHFSDIVALRLCDSATAFAPSRPPAVFSRFLVAAPFSSCPFHWLFHRLSIGLVRSRARGLQVPRPGFRRAFSPVAHVPLLLLLPLLPPRRPLAAISLQNYSINLYYHNSNRSSGLPSRKVGAVSGGLREGRISSGTVCRKRWAGIATQNLNNILP